MVTARIASTALALLLGSWLGYDGARAFVKGNYTTAMSGPYAHQLGPWAKLVRKVGIDPLGAPVKAAHVLLGALWWVGAVAFVCRSTIGVPVLMISAIASIWYVPFGTIIGAAEVALLIWPRENGGA